MKKLTAVVLILLLLFSVPLADAYLGAVISLATVLRVGAIYVAQVWRNTLVRDLIISGIAHLAAASALWLAYDRGTNVPASERYINVKLTNAEDAIRSERDHHTPAGSRTWGDAVNSYSLPGCTGAGDYGWYSSPTGTYYCCINDGSCPTACYAQNTGNQYTGNQCFGKGYKCGVCDPTVRTKYEETADSIVNDAESIKRVQAGLGKDLTTGSPTLGSSPASGAYVISVGGDVYETNNYNDATSFSGSGGSTGSAGPTATEIGTAVGTALNTNLTAIKTSVDGVKTSTDGVKTSVDGVKTSTDGVKASVDAINEKVGTNPGSLTAPTYDNTYTNPTENSIADRIGSFIGNNPIIGAISGSHLSLSGAVCSATVGEVFGKALTLNFCWMETYLTMFGNVMVIFAGLTAAFIIFRRGD